MIRIISDRGDVYEVGSTVSEMDFIQSYCDTSSDEDTKDWLQSIPIPCAVGFIADAWGIEYKFV